MAQPPSAVLPFTAEGGCATWDHRFIHRNPVGGALVRLAESICLSATLAKPQAACQPCCNNLREEALVFRSSGTPRSLRPAARCIFACLGNRIECGRGRGHSRHFGGELCRNRGGGFSCWLAALAGIVIVLWRPVRLAAPRIAADPGKAELPPPAGARWRRNSSNWPPPRPSRIPPVGPTASSTTPWPTSAIAPAANCPPLSP